MMSENYKNSKSNYDRWKPGTKLACMMSLKHVCQDSKFYDSASNRFNSLTWHTVAENLNKEYPDYAKRFTNINVKDRYDRVLKHHKVFKKMAYKKNGFIWNPENFCFEMNEILIKQYENDDNNNKSLNQNGKNNGNDSDIRITPNELNIVRFLSKPGHIDLEYYHRYIYQFSNQQELRDDVVVNTPSFIEDSISKGILNLVNKSNFVKNEYDQSQFDTTSPLLLHQSNSGSVTSNTTSSSNSIPMLPNGSIPSHSSLSSSSSSLIQPPSSIITPQQQQQQQQHQHGQHPPPPGATQELDFAGLISTNTTHPHPHGHGAPGGIHHGQQQGQQGGGGAQQALINPMMSDGSGMNPTGGIHRDSLSGEPFFKKPKLNTTNSGGQLTAASFIGAGFNYDSYESMITGAPPPLPPPPPQAPSAPVQVQPQASHQEIHPPLETLGSSGTSSGKLSGSSTSGGIVGLTSGEAILKIHRDFLMMKNLINEHIINLRMNKLISFKDFERIQIILNNNDQFIRSAYKRIDDDNKLIELMNIYLNNAE